MTTAGSSGSNNHLKVIGFFLMFMAIFSLVLDFLPSNPITGKSFDGYDYREIFTTRFLFQGLTKVMDWFLAVLGTILFFKRPNRAEAMSITLGLSLIVTIIINGVIRTASYHVLLALFVWVFLRKRNMNADERTSHNLTVSGLLFFDLVGYNFVQSLTNSSEINRFIFPIWVLYILYYVNENTDSVMYGMLIGVVLIVYIFYLFGVAEIIVAPSRPVTTATRTAVSNFITRVIHAPKKMWTMVYEGGRNITTLWNPDHYVGQVEQNRDVPLGVYIERVQQGDVEYYEGDKVTIWADVVARTLDKPFPLSIECLAKVGNDEITAEKIDPEDPVNIDIFSEIPLTCQFDDLPAGTHNIIIRATFDFTTLGYLKMYLMNRDRLRSDLRKITGAGVTSASSAVGDRSEVLSRLYDISDTDPVAVYTNGPVGLGIETNTPPLGVSKEEPINPRLGFTVKNSWEGKIAELKDVEIQVPEGIEIDTTTCDVNYNSVQGSYKSYKLQNPELLKNIKNFRSYNCKMIITEDALDNTPVTIRYIRVIAKYEYILETVIPVTIKKATDPLSGSPATVPPSAPDTPLTGRLDPDYEITLYYTACDTDFSNWCSPKKADCFTSYTDITNHYGTSGRYCIDERNGGFCCVPEKDRGFYEEVMCQGSGLAFSKTKLCRYTTIKPDRAASLASCVATPPDLPNGITASGTNPTPHKTIAVDFSLISKGENVFIDFGPGNPWTGCYIAEDTGGKIIGKHIDIYTGPCMSSLTRARSQINAGEFKGVVVGGC